MKTSLSKSDGPSSKKDMTNKVDPSKAKHKYPELRAKYSTPQAIDTRLNELYEDKKNWGYARMDVRQNLETGENVRDQLVPGPISLDHQVKVGYEIRRAKGA